MYIAQAYSKNFDFVKYLPIPIVFLLIMIGNYVALAFLPVDVDEIMRQQIAEKGENRVFFETLLPLAIFLLALRAWVKWVHKQSIKSLTTARPKVDWGRILFSFFLWGIITAALTSAAYFSAPENFEVNFNLGPFLAIAAIAIVMVPLQTSFEEYFFRAYLMQGIGVATRSRLIPLVVTSVFFGLMHIANPEVGKLGYIVMLYYIGTGFFLGIVTLMDDGLELSLGFHAANNVVSALLVTSDWTAFQTPSVLKDTSEPAAGFDVLLPIFVIYPILLFIFSRKYNWPGWKEKLAGPVILPNKADLN